MRDCYAISRMIYETSINVLYIAATEFEAMDDMIKYTEEKSKHESTRSIAIDKEAVFLVFDEEKGHTVGFAKNNPLLKVKETHGIGLILILKEELIL